MRLPFEVAWVGREDLGIGFFCSRSGRPRRRILGTPFSSKASEAFLLIARVLKTKVRAMSRLLGEGVLSGWVVGYEGSLLGYLVEIIQ